MTYLLRNIDSKLWLRVKKRAAGRPLRRIILDLLEHYATHGLPGAAEDPHPGASASYLRAAAVHAAKTLKK